MVVVVLQVVVAEVVYMVMFDVVFHHSITLSVYECSILKESIYVSSHGNLNIRFVINSYSIHYFSKSGGVQTFWFSSSNFQLNPKLVMLVLFISTGFNESFDADFVTGLMKMINNGCSNDRRLSKVYLSIHTH